MNPSNKAKIFSHLIEEHINDAAFLWLIRAQAMNQAHQNVASIHKLETRINNHFKAMYAAYEVAWACALKAAEFQESGEVFVVAMLALASGEQGKINIACELAEANSETIKAFVSALAWVPSDAVNAYIKSWLSSANPQHKYVAIAACSAKRLDPKRYLTAMLNDPANSRDARLLARMLRLVGELKRHDLLPLLVKAQTHSSADVVFWAHWSALLLGERSALQGIEPYVLHAGIHQARAINLAFRCQEQTQVWDWINLLIQSSPTSIPAITAIAALGDPYAINWLLARMQEPAYATIAGDAFSMITGVDLLQQGLNETQRINNDDADNEADDSIPLSNGFENSPTPNPEKVQQHWQEIQQNFIAGQRYFCGRAIEPAHLEAVFLEGRQTQRLASALEFALLNPSHPYINAKGTLGRWKTS